MIRSSPSSFLFIVDHYSTNSLHNSRKSHAFTMLARFAALAKQAEEEKRIEEEIQAKEEEAARLKEEKEQEFSSWVTKAQDPDEPTSKRHKFEIYDTVVKIGKPSPYHL